jgi:hypothetical protein
MTWSLLETICRLLAPDERQAVLGDLAETGETGMRALTAVAGLVVRRQLGLWKSWRPWVASLGLLPVLLTFSCVTPSIVLIIERYPWKNVPQSRQEIILMLFAAILLTAFFSWAVGFVTASLARRAMVSVAALLATGALWTICQQQVARTPLGILFTGLFQLVLHLAPFAYGLRCGAGCGRLASQRSLLLAGAALLLLLILTPFQWPAIKDLLILTFFSWPILYLIATARWREPQAGSSQRQSA